MAALPLGLERGTTEVSSGWAALVAEGGRPEVWEGDRGNWGVFTGVTGRVACAVVELLLLLAASASCLFLSGRARLRLLRVGTAT